MHPYTVREADKKLDGPSLFAMMWHLGSSVEQWLEVLRLSKKVAALPPSPGPSWAELGCPTDQKHALNAD